MVIVRSILFRLFLVLGSLMATWLSLELVLHIIGYVPQPFEWNWATSQPLYVLDRKLIYRPTSYHRNDRAQIYTDEYGFRLNPSERPAAQKDVVTIAIVGDSFVWGNTTARDSYPNLLQGKLNASLTHQYKVINAGVSGYSTDQQFLWLTTHVIPYVHPDIIIWNINFNDVDDNVARPLFDLKNYQLVSIPGWLNQVYIQGFVFNILRTTPLRKTLTASLLVELLGKVKFYQISTSSEKSREWSLEKMRYLFEETKSICNSHHIKLIFAISPSQSLIENLEEAKLVEDTHLQIKRLIDSDTLVIDQNPIFFHLAASSSAISSSSVLGVQHPSFTMFLNEEDTFPRGYWHPNELGNNLMAETVKQALLGRN